MNRRKSMRSLVNWWLIFKNVKCTEVYFLFPSAIFLLTIHLPVFFSFVRFAFTIHISLIVLNFRIYPCNILLSNFGEFRRWFHTISLKHRCALNDPALFANDFWMELSFGIQWIKSFTTDVTQPFNNKRVLVYSECFMMMATMPLNIW